MIYIDDLSLFIHLEEKFLKNKISLSLELDLLDQNSLRSKGKELRNSNSIFYLLNR